MLKITQFRVINTAPPLSLQNCLSNRLLEEADKRELDVGEEKKEQKIVKAVLAEAKISWHAFNLDSVHRKADDAFEMGSKVKDSLRSKLYPQQSRTNINQ